MGWTAPRTWVAGEVVTADLMNTHLKNNLRYLKGLDSQVPTIESGLTIDNTDGDERVLLPLLSTAECSTVLNAEGEVAFDEQTHDLKWYNGSAIISAKDMATTKIASQAAGDIFYATSATAVTRLAKGTALQYLRQNSGLTAPEWATINFSALMTWNNAADTTIAASATRYVLLNSSLAPTATIANSYWLAPAIGTAQNFYVNVSANSLDGVCDITFRDGAGATVTVQYAATETGTKSDTVHTQAIAAGDTPYVLVTAAAGTGTITIKMVSIMIQ